MADHVNDRAFAATTGRNSTKLNVLNNLGLTAHNLSRVNVETDHFYPLPDYDKFPEHVRHYKSQSENQNNVNTTHKVAFEFMRTQ